MPNPLSKVRPDASIKLGVHTFENHPKFMLHIHNVIHCWSKTDLFLSHLATTFLRSDFEVVAAMFQALSSAEARRAAMIAAAQEVLDEEDFWLVCAVLAEIRSSREERNRFAHHIWAACEELPENLLLVDPKATGGILMSINTALASLSSGAPQSSPELRSFDHKRVQVYSKQDFEQASESAANAHSWVAKLYLSIAIQPSPADPMRTELLEQPAIRRRYDKISQGKRT